MMLLDTVKTLCALFGPSGCEDEVREYIRREAEPFADEIMEDTAGNLLVFKRGRTQPRRTVMLAAHMDEVGVIVKNISEDGFLSFDFVGGVDRRVVIGKKVFLGEKRIPGIIGMKPIHLTTKEEREKVPKTDKLYIDIGAADKAAAEEVVEIGTYGCFGSECTELANGFVRMKAIDDRIGCAILFEKLKEDLPIDTWFAFTVQEEVGCRGAFGAAFRIKPQIALVVEGTTAADSPQSEGAAKVCMPGQGPVIPFMDGGAIYDRKLFCLLRDLADEKGIKWQTKTRIAGGTDAQAIQRTAGGCKVGAVSAAVRYIHSPSSVGAVQDFEAMKALVDAFLEKMEDSDEELA